MLLKFDFRKQNYADGLIKCGMK